MPTSRCIRAAAPADLAEIVALIGELADFEHLADEVGLQPEDLARHLFGPEPTARVLIAETDHGEVAGFALWYWTFSSFLGRRGIWLEDLFVRPAHRGHGHGRALLDRLRTLTDGRVEWAVLDWNRPAIELYRSLGAEPVTGWTRYRWSVDP
ncbi:MAG: GNAT family N-acetyltransferase [Acidimicrobiales bacterium]